MSDYLIVGLGNPGTQYQQTRHNIGWLAIDYLADQLQANLQLKSQLEAWLGQGHAWQSKLLLAKPVTYMNLSGRSVQKLLHYFKIPLEQLLVISDDVSLPFGRMRFREEGSSGGQKGIQSIIATMGSQQFARLRIGIGAPTQRGSLSHFVLSAFGPEEWPLLPRLFERVQEGIQAWIGGDLQKTMHTCNTQVFNQQSQEE